MVHFGNQFALSRRDRIVGVAQIRDKASINYNSGNRFKAALIDFSGNLFIGSIIQSIMAFSVLAPYVSSSYQGWIGGIVSVDSSHLSRFRKIKPALYYVFVLLLQFIPYSLAIGAATRAGYSTYVLNKHKPISQYKFDSKSIKDLFLVYLLVIPLFFVASCFEFLSTWN